MLEKTVTDTVRAAGKLVEASFKKAWSILDAASEKQKPSEMLSPKAVGAIQGKEK